MKPFARASTNAKVNLFLRVLARRPDGYHEIETVLHGISLADEITLSPHPERRVALKVRAEADLGRQATLPAERDNLAFAAATMVMQRVTSAGGASISISKRIPVGAGLGGGSANAAGALVLANEMWGRLLGTDELLEMAASLGSDVPYFVRGGSALATARGERVTPLEAPRPMSLVLGISHRPLMTRAVYERFEPGGGAPSGEAVVRALASGDAAAVASSMHNDLERPASCLRPELAAKKEALLAAGALGACLSGSGPTLFGVARNDEDARVLAARVGGVFDRVEVASSRPRCIEPVP